MDPIEDDIFRRSREFAEQQAIRIDRRLGFGKDGTVWETDRYSAVKVFRHAILFQRELAVYELLSECGVVEVQGHRVPQLIYSDRAILAIEMTIVKPPFVLDFASAYLEGTAPVFPAEVQEEWLENKKEQFGQHWRQVSQVLTGLERLGIQMTDVHPGNIAFPEDQA